MTMSAGPLITWRESSTAARALLLGVLVNRLGGFIQVFLVLFLIEQHFSYVEAGIALGGYGLGAILGLVIGGSLTDHLGPRSTILLSVSGSAVLTLALLYVSRLGGIAAVVAVSVVLGTLNQGYRPAAASMLSAETAKPRQVMIFAMYRLATNIGSAVAPLLGLALIAISYDCLFWGEAAAAFAFAIVILFVVPRSVDDTARRLSMRSATSLLSPPQRLKITEQYGLYLLAMFLFSLVYVLYLGLLPLTLSAARFAKCHICRPRQPERRGCCHM